MRRREFIAGLGAATTSAAAWPLAARAQQPAMPVIGYLGLISPETQASTVAGFRKGLREVGYVEGRNVAIEFRWAESQVDRFSALAADLIRSRVDVIFAHSPTAVRATRAASATIPIVFIMGEDPVTEALVASLNRPSRGVTGVSDFANQLAGKLLGLLRDTVPNAAVFAFLVNPTHPNAASDTKDAQAAASALGRELRVLMASTDPDFEAAFAAMAQFRVGGLFVNTDPFFDDRREQLVALAARHAIPTIYARRSFPVAGGLMSYEADRSETSRQAGIYVGRILKGEKPDNLPVQQAIKFTFSINLKTARALGLEIPPGVLAIADEVIE
jgi:putative ABC transport system substrate-binding protein